MHFSLIAINAKYIHSNLGVYSLASYAGKYVPEVLVDVSEYTINQNNEDILEGIYKTGANAVGFSCYIWNINIVLELVIDLKKIMPECDIWLGGPEVSYRAEKLMLEYPQITGIMCGEGELIFTELLKDYRRIDKKTYIGGIRNSKIPLEMDALVFPYPKISEEVLANRIFYYESSRGCPYSCSYCLSSIDKEFRTKSNEKTKQELSWFLSHKVKQVKFVDRTFNADKKHAMEVWKYIKEQDNGITNFHFEIAADSMDNEECAIIKNMRPGLIQLEIGVQTVNPETLIEIRRPSDIDKIQAITEKIQSYNNTHVHLDLIVGLPFEDYDSFCLSYDRVYNMKPDQLQLGFLKVLSGSYMEQMKDSYGILHTDRAPYEVLNTKWISYNSIRKLKAVEEMTEVYYNSRQFTQTLTILESCFDRPYNLYQALANYYDEHGLNKLKHARLARYNIIYDFFIDFISKQESSDLSDRLSEIKDALITDLYLRENIKSRPDWAPKQDTKKATQIMHEHGFKTNLAHVEFLNNKTILLFNYSIRDPLTYNAEMEII